MTMYVSHETIKDMRMGFLKQMHEYIRCHIGDEEAYERWILIMPDESSEEDFESIADDDELWVDVCTVFGKLIKEYEGR